MDRLEIIPTNHLMFIHYSVDAVLVDPSPHPCPVYFIVREVVIEMDVVVLVFQLVRDVGV